MTASFMETPNQLIARMEGKALKHLSPFNNGHMVSRSWGSGPPLVLIHGNFGSWLHWIKNIDALSEKFRVIAVDIPGFGDSSLPTEPYTINSIGKIIADGLIQIVGDEKITLVGFSFGTYISAETAEVLGARVRKLILVSPARSLTGVNRPTMEPLVKWRGLMTKAERDAAHRRNLEIMMIGDSSRIDELAIAIQGMNAERSRLRALAVRADAFTQSNMPHLDCPVCFIWADRDGLIGPHMHDRPQWVHRFRPESRYIIIPDAGHWVPYEQPDAFNRAIIELAN